MFMLDFGIALGAGSSMYSPLSELLADEGFFTENGRFVKKTGKGEFFADFLIERQSPTSKETVTSKAARHFLANLAKQIVFQINRNSWGRSMRPRAYRRQQVRRHLQRRLSEDRNQHYNDLSCSCWFDPKAIARFKEQPKRCSCWNCRSPRYASKGDHRLTIQERKAFGNGADY
jgi:hypothetical protein